MKCLQTTFLGLALAIASVACAENPAKEDGESFEFAELATLQDQSGEMPPLEPFEARDGTELSFRRYEADSNVHAILLHGSTAHSAYLHPFAEYLSSEDVANVYALDLRGHGPSPERRGDIDYIGQLEDDIADLIGHIESRAGGDARFIVGGHSSGGGMALRFGGSEYGALSSGILLLAPYLGHDAPMVRENSGGWASPNVPKIIGISVLNGLGITGFNDAKVLSFNLPEKYRNGSETLEYSFRLMKGMHPADYRESLRNTESPVLVMVGTEDEAFHVDEFEPGIRPYKPEARITHLEGVSHLGIIRSDAAMAEAARWIAEK